VETNNLEFVHENPREKNKFSWVLLLLLMGICILIIDYFKVPNPTIICMIVVVFSMFYGGYVSGVLNAAMTLIYSAYFFSDKHRFFHYSDQNLYKIIIILIAFLFMIIVTGVIKKKLTVKTNELEKINQLLFRKSMLDELSGLYNYRYFRYQLQEMWSQRIESQSEISLAIVDIDFFKQYNDYYGHQEGNICIKTISDILKFNVSCPGGFVARYGGEEFVIVMPDVSAKEAKKITRDICSTVEKHRIEHIKSKLYHYLTVSIGFATIIPTIGVSVDALIKRADDILYEAKKNGRNRALGEDDLENIANIRQTDKRFIFSKQQQELYERLLIPIGVYQVVNDRIVTLAVSDGLCEMFELGRIDLMKHFDSDMFQNVHPDDVERLSNLQAALSKEQGEYDVIYRARFRKVYRKMHVIGKFQTVGEDTRVAFFVYTEMKNI